jgi:transmembrane sensor
LENKDQLKTVYLNFLKNQCSKTEVEGLLTYFDVGDEFLLKNLINSELDIVVDEVAATQEEEDKLIQIFKSVKAITQDSQPKIVPFYKRPLFLGLTAACMALMVISVSWFVYHNKNRPVLFNVENDVGPGENKAVLTLANGKQIILSAGVNDALEEQSGVKITKTAAGQLVYSFNGNQAKGTSTEENRISTPKGGQYQLQLADGTKIWLNAASSLKFPVLFRGPKRNVELEGEAYFEVAKDKARPFIVKTADQELEVLGTHFNLNAYGHSAYTKTTLLEGSVKVNHIILKPGEESTLTGDQIGVKKIDTDNSISWKNGFFTFEEEPLESILTTIGRWYDLDVKFKDEELRTKVFSGRISRYIKVSQVLSKLALTRSVRFEIQGKTIIVMK